MVVTAGDTPSALDLIMRRNNDPLRLQFNISDDGTPIDMTSGYAVKMQVRAYPGAADPALLTLTQAATANGSVITLNDAGFELAIDKADAVAAAFPPGTPEPPEREPWIGAYDIIVTEPGGDTNPWYFGSFTVEEGVTVA